jgi:hypothetical protein
MEKQEIERLLAVGSILRNDAKRIFALISEHRDELETIEITIHGGSMSPAIPKNSAIRIQLDYKGVHSPGQIIAFLQDQKIMVHRIHHRVRGYFLTRGDAMTAPDPPVRSEMILGPVIAFQKNGHWLTPGNINPLGPVRTFAAKLRLGFLAIVLQVNVKAAFFLTRRNAS